jgi:hypothetical protein
MTTEIGYTCSCCGKHHAALPMSYSVPAPDGWQPELANQSDCLLTQEHCVMNGEHFFIRGLINLPVVDSPTPFSWDVWISLSQENFARTVALWNTPGREREQPCFGWLQTTLPVYTPTTLHLKTNVWTRPIGQRPFIALEPTKHPLAVEQRTGITMDRVREFAEALLHQA